VSNLLNIGKTGLDASKSSLKTTSHNIANANTEGYSRQRVHQTSNTPINKSGHIMGTGARVVSVNRIHDQFVENKLSRTITSNEFYGTRSESLTQLENIFNEVDGEGLNYVLNDFYNSFRELANQPENESIRSLVRDKADLVVKDFKRINDKLETEARGVDQKLKVEVQDVNTLLKRTADINKKIAVLEAGGQQTGDLRDQRDNLLRSLSESFEIKTYEDEKNRFVISAVGIGTLVTGTEVQELATKPVSKEQSKNGMPGSVEVYYKTRPNNPISDRFSGGRMGSLIKARNEDIQTITQKVDSIAYDFANSVNAIHRRGFVNRKIPLNEMGNPPLFDKKGPTTGINFFAEPMGIDGASKNLSLSREVESDLTNVATALDPNSPGDNRVALAISKLQHEKIAGNGSTTLEEEYLQTIGNIGIETGKAIFDKEQSEGLLAQAKNMKERISGVSIDEETANMVRFQHAYEASAKVMQTADEMFQTVLAIKR
jgi:flagellar hook-associated protein 1 FlgK